MSEAEALYDEYFYRVFWAYFPELHVFRFYQIKTGRIDG